MTGRGKNLEENKSLPFFAAGIRYYLNFLKKNRSINLDQNKN